jgi:hypothetical protein
VWREGGEKTIPSWKNSVGKTTSRLLEVRGDGESRWLMALILVGRSLGSDLNIILEKGLVTGIIRSSNLDSRLHFGNRF